MAARSLNSAAENITLSANEKFDANISFPLTPAPSPGEREKRSQLLSETRGWIRRTVIRTTPRAQSLFPLPGGEGQGGGKARIAIAIRCSFRPVHPHRLLDNQIQ